jgi:hypothetical protein
VLSKPVYGKHWDLSFLASVYILFCLFFLDVLFQWLTVVGGSGKLREERMEDFNSETDSDYTSYWRDWVSLLLFL